MLAVILGITVFNALMIAGCWYRLHTVMVELEMAHNCRIQLHQSQVDLSFSLARATSAEAASKISSELSRILENTANTPGNHT